MNKFLVLDQQMWKTEGNLFTNKAGALPSENLNFIPIPSDQTDIGYISPVIVLGLDNANGNNPGTDVIEEISISGDNGQLFEMGQPDQEKYFTLKKADMFLDLGVSNANESVYGTPTLKDLEMSLRGWSKFWFYTLKNTADFNFLYTILFQFR